MFAVWKYPLTVRDEQFIEMPQSSRVLHIDTQNGVPCLWALVDDQRPKLRRRVLMYGTGHPITGPVADHLGSFLLDSGALVFHVFDGGWQ
jgi:hypothetical protein